MRCRFGWSSSPLPRASMIFPYPSRKGDGDSDGGGVAVEGDEDDEDGDGDDVDEDEEEEEEDRFSARRDILASASARSAGDASGDWLICGGGVRGVENAPVDCLCSVSKTSWSSFGKRGGLGEDPKGELGVFDDRWSRVVLSVARRGGDRQRRQSEVDERASRRARGVLVKVRNEAATGADAMVLLVGCGLTQDRLIFDFTDGA